MRMRPCRGALLVLGLCIASFFREDGWRRCFLAYRPGVGGRGALSLTARSAEDYSSYKGAELKEMCREAGLPISGTKAVDYSSYKKAELQELCRKAGLPISGNKPVLIERLQAAASSAEVKEEEEEEQEEEEEEEVEVEQKKAKKPAAKASAKKPQSKGKAGAIFEIGEEVEGFYDDDGEWFGAKVVKDLGKGGFRVAWDEDGEEYDLEAGYVRKRLGEVDPEGPFEPGEAVNALCKDDGQWYDGIIQQDNGDGTFTLLWDEDGEEYVASAKSMRKRTPPLALEELVIDQKMKGVVTNVREFGAFVDVGAERDGLLHISQVLPVDENAPAFEEGDRVTALYKEDGEDDDWYPATIDSVNKDKTYTITWDEDGDEPYTAKEHEMKLETPRMGVKVNDLVEVYVSKVEEGKLGLSQYAAGSRPTGRGRRSNADVGEFADVGPNEWFDGTVKKLMTFGAFVAIRSPSGKEAQGLVHVSRIREGFVEDIYSELEEGQSVSVRVESVDVQEGRLSLSMK